jgi:hypothetical protein
MPSILSGLYKQAVDPLASREPLEDFTTEAVAGATRREPELLLSALAAAGAFDPSQISGQPCTVLTQVPYSPPGDEIRPDLVLVWSAPFPGRELWLEVKVGAPLSSGEQQTDDSTPSGGLSARVASPKRFNQLTRYALAQRWATGLDGVTRALVLLAPADLRADGKLADELASMGLPIPGFLSWRNLVAQIRRAPKVGVLWQELAVFLKEKHVADDLAFPITSREAVSLPDAYRLYKKAFELCKLINAAGLQRHPGIPGGWWPTANLTREVNGSFFRRGRLGISLTGGSRIKFFCGLDAEEDGETMCVVTMRTDPKYGQLRARAHKLAQDAGLTSAGWTLSYEGRALLAARVHPVGFPTAEAVVEWVMARCDDLQRAGLFDLQRQSVDGAGDEDLPDSGDDPE